MHVTVELNINIANFTAELARVEIKTYEFDLLANI